MRLKIVKGVRSYLAEEETGNPVTSMPDEAWAVIVNAVNNYDAVLAALSGLMAVFPASGMFMLRSLGPAIEKARATLDAAGVKNA